MPRFTGRYSRPTRWEVVALIVMVLVVLFVLDITGTVDIFG